MSMLIQIALFLLGPFVNGPDPAPSHVLRVRHDFFTTDNLGNIYLVMEGELLKYNRDGKRMARYSNLRLGNIASVDATNPLKILVYYQDYQQVVFLDNQLSVNGTPISLQDLGLEQAALVCASANNSFWVYERRNNELMRFDQDRKRIASTGNLKQVLGEDVSPVQMKEHNNFLYLNSPDAGIHVFDIYAAFSKLIPLKSISDLQVQESLLYYSRGRSFCSYHLTNFEESCDSLRTVPPICTQVNNKRIYRSYHDSVTVASL